MTNDRKEYIPLENIIEEFKAYLTSKVHHDVVTIVGEGEPLLYSKVGALVAELKKLTTRPIALITNGALLSVPEIRKEIGKADIVLPSLDASSTELFKKINRPHGSIVFEDVIRGLNQFSKEYQGQLWIEVMLVKGINDNRGFFLRLKELLKAIHYHKLYLNAPVRPPAESYATQPTREMMEEAQSILGGISINELVSDGFYSGIEDDYEAVLSIIKRHPMNQFEIKSFILTRGNTATEDFFQRLDHDNAVEVVNYKDYYTYRLK